MLIMTTDSRLVDTSVAVMIVDGRSLVAMSLSFSTLASDRPCGMEGERASLACQLAGRVGWLSVTDLDLEQVASRGHPTTREQVYEQKEFCEKKGEDQARELGGGESGTDWTLWTVVSPAALSLAMSCALIPCDIMSSM